MGIAQQRHAIQHCEGWYFGDEKFEPTPEKVIGVRFIKGKATEFLICSVDGAQKWLTRAQAIALAEAKKLLAIVVRGPYGVYLRPFPHQTRFHDMINL